MRKKPTLISLYSGCGGSALGFKNAGFAITFMNDRNRDACETLEANFPDSLVVRQNIKDVFNFGDADVIEGGFPCQGFSLAGPRKVNDERNSMYHYLKRAIMLVNPKFFVVENVKGFVTIGENGKGQFFNKDGTIKKLGKIATAIVDELASTGAGYNVEYSGMGFALFFLGEYANMILMSCVTVILFMGGWLPPFDILPLNLIPGPIWFALKTLIFVSLFIWARAAYPRYRYDQLMRLGWKIFLPISLGWVILTAGILISFNWLPVASAT